MPASPSDICATAPTCHLTYCHPRSAALFFWLLAGLLVMAGPLTAQQMDVSIGTRHAGSPMPGVQSPLSMPVVSTDVIIRARRATAWQDGSGRMLLLEGDVHFEMGLYAFRGTQALIRIDHEERIGRTISHLAVYLADARQVGGRGSIAAQAPYLLVTASTTGEMALETDLLDRATQAPDNAMVRDGLARIVRFYERLTLAAVQFSEPTLLSASLQEDRKARRLAIHDMYDRFRAPTPAHQDMAEQTGMAAKVQRQREAIADRTVTDTTRATLATADRPLDRPDDPQRADLPDLALLPSRGVVYLTQERIVFERHEDQDTLMLIGNVRALYHDDESDRSVTLKAERMVIFLGEGSRDDARRGPVPASAVTGIYLEDNAIISDGAFTVRAPRMFYDLAANRAILLDAVLYTWNPRLNIPLYVRAETLKQTSRTSFEADRALITTSEFGEPHFAIGLERVTIEQREAPAARSAREGGNMPTPGQGQYYFQGKNATARWGDWPIFWLPGIAGVDGGLPLASASIGNSSRNGFEVQTGWHIFRLFGQEEPEGVEMIGHLDFRGHHGIATGLDLSYDRPEMFGAMNSYFLPYDSGTDKIPGRRDVSHDGDQRGYARWQHRQYLANDIELSLEFAYVSDPTFLDTFFPDQSDATKPYETSIFLKRQENDWALTFLAKYNINDFAPQMTTLQAPGYQVDKLPELGYYRVGTSLLDDRLTLFSENRYSLVRARFGNDKPRDRGFNNRWSQILFGINNNQSFRDAADAANFPQNFHNRLDSRQELNMPLTLGIFNVTPYLAGRVTAYDSDFKQFSGNTDPVRLWGMAGTRLHTSFTNTYAVENRMLDLHQLRHTIEPSINLYYGDTTVASRDLPGYDSYVEGINSGYGTRLGLLQTFQTQRGGPGRYRNVDWLTLQTDFVFMNRENNPNAPIARFYDYRPEYSTGGDHFYVDMLWMVTDTLGLSGEMIYSLENRSEVAYWRLGTTLDITPRARFFVDYESIEPTNSHLLTYGLFYEMTAKYSVGFSHQVDLGGGRNQEISVALERKLPRWRLQLLASYQDLNDDFTIGIMLLPEGIMTGSSGSGSARSARAFLSGN